MRLLLASLCSLGLACGTEADPVAKASPAPPAITLTGVTFVNSRGSQVFARGHAATLTYVRQSGDSVATDLALRFPREERNGGERANAIDLHAPRARGNPLEGKVTAEGGVRFQNAKGDRGATAVASYDGQKGTAHGDQPVELQGPGFVLHAPGFRWQAHGSAGHGGPEELDDDDRLDLGPSDVLTRGRVP